mgnify:CR=1 FL=1
MVNDLGNTDDLELMPTGGGIWCGAIVDERAHR